MNKKPKILFCCMIIVGSAAFAQTKPLAKNDLLLALQFKTAPWKPFITKQKAAPLFSGNTMLAPDFYAKQLGFFCRQEIKMDKAIKIPFRFRLGSVEQCNWLEGKKR